MYKVAVVGAGQLGSRYIQGLKKIRSPLSITVVDPSSTSLNKSRALWNSSLKDTLFHEVKWVTNLGMLPAEIDLVIVSTTADHRPGIVKDIASKHQVKYWVLEKVLAQSVQQLEKMSECLKFAQGSWVNTPRRMMAWHQSLKTEISSSPMHVSLLGADWGMACNSIHFIDLVAWWTGETLKTINISGLEKKWHPSKRVGFFEIFGCLVAEFSSGSTLLLNSSNDDIEVRIDVLSNQTNWSINEAKGHAISSAGDTIFGRLELQSEMTESLVTKILSTGTCELPTYEESMPMHIVLVEQLLTNWNLANNCSRSTLPIT